MSKKFTLILIAVFALAIGTFAIAKGKPDKPKPTPGGCNPPLIFCLDVWDPVVCDDGKVYSNQCYADRACATGCEPTGGGPTQ